MKTNKNLIVTLSFSLFAGIGAGGCFLIQSNAPVCGSAEHEAIIEKYLANNGNPEQIYSIICQCGGFEWKNQHGEIACEGSDDEVGPGDDYEDLNCPGPNWTQGAASVCSHTELELKQMGAVVDYQNLSDMEQFMASLWGPGEVIPSCTPGTGSDGQFFGCMHPGQEIGKSSINDQWNGANQAYQFGDKYCGVCQERVEAYLESLQGADHLIGHEPYLREGEFGLCGVPSLLPQQNPGLVMTFLTKKPDEPDSAASPYCYEDWFPIHIKLSEMGGKGGVVCLEDPMVRNDGIAGNNCSIMCSRDSDCAGIHHYTHKLGVGVESVCAGNPLDPTYNPALCALAFPNVPLPLNPDVVLDYFGSSLEWEDEAHCEPDGFDTALNSEVMKCTVSQDMFDEIFLVPAILASGAFLEPSRDGSSLRIESCNKTSACSWAGLGAGDEIIALGMNQGPVMHLESGLEAWYELQDEGETQAVVVKADGRLVTYKINLVANDDRSAASTSPTRAPQ